MSLTEINEYALLLNVFREGLSRGLVSAQEVVSWVDSIILNTEEPNYFFIELALAHDKNNLIEIIGSYVCEADSPICPRVLFGILYRNFIDENTQLTIEGVAKLLGTFNSFDSLSGFEMNYIYAFDEYEVFYLPDLTQLQIELIAFLSVYDVFTLSNYQEWEDINIEFEKTLKKKEIEAVDAAAAFTNARKNNLDKQIKRQGLKTSIVVVGLLALMLIVALVLNSFQIPWSSLYTLLIVLSIIMTRKFLLKEKRN